MEINRLRVTYGNMKLCDRSLTKGSVADERTWEHRIFPCKEFSVSPMVWMLSAICGALLRQRFIAALPNYDPYPGPSKAARMPRRKGATGRICLCN